MDFRLDHQHLLHLALSILLGLQSPLLLATAANTAATKTYTGVTNQTIAIQLNVEILDTFPRQSLTLEATQSCLLNPSKLDNCSHAEYIYTTSQAFDYTLMTIEPI